MSHNTIDHIALGRSRVATQYTESPKFLAYLEGLLGYATTLEAVLDTISKQSDIDVAEGVNLDVLGDIVGISRIIPFSIPLQFFGFTDSVPVGMPYGEDGHIEIGSRFREEGELATASSVLNDIEYRPLIRAKIIKNHSHGTGEDLIAGLKFIFDTDLIIIDDNMNMTIDIAIGRNLTFLEKALFDLDILPRPAGVRINQKETFVLNGYFGFEDQAGAQTFDIGILAEEF
jgi:hypothetical protein